MGVVASLLLVVALATAPWLLWLELAPRSPGLVSRARQRWFPPREPEAVVRPIELIADDVRVRAARFHALDDRVSRVRRAALASAYDVVLAECCNALDLAHLLGVLEPGAELDRERRRVELLLHSYGLPAAEAA
jgi:hypothetical protein